MRNARFWHYNSKKDSWIKLTLKPGQSVEFHSYSTDEEGWHSTSERYTSDGIQVNHEWISDGRDCDGRLTQAGESVCLIDNLQSRLVEDFPDWPLLPQWELVDSSQRDEYAEMMGY